MEVATEAMSAATCEELVASSVAQRATQAGAIQQLKTQSVNLTMFFSRGFSDEQRLYIFSFLNFDITSSTVNFSQIREKATAVMESARASADSAGAAAEAADAAAEAAFERVTAANAAARKARERAAAAASRASKERAKAAAWRAAKAARAAWRATHEAPGES